MKIYLDGKAPQLPQNVKLTTDSGDEISSDLITSIDIEMIPDGVVTATCAICVSTLDISGVRMMINNIEAKAELIDAMREYFLNESLANNE